MSTKKLIDDAVNAAQRGAVSPYILRVDNRNGADRGERPGRHAVAMDALERIGMLSDFGIFPTPERAAAAAPSAAVPAGKMLDESIERFLKDFASKKRA